MWIDYTELSCPLCDWAVYDMPLKAAIDSVRAHLREEHPQQEQLISDSVLAERFVVLSFHED